MKAWTRTHVAFAAIFAVGVLLRVVWLDAIPNPCADEGNWTWIPYDGLLGRPYQLPPDARFVPMTFADLVRWSFGRLGPSFAAARAVCVAGLMLGVFVSYVVLCRMRARRAAIVATALLALHPWAVFWSRTVSVPYALSLACSTAGPLLVLLALDTPRRWERAALFVAAGQVLFIGMHFSPLALVSIAACGLWIVGSRARWRHLANPFLWVGVGLGSIHAVKIVRGIFDVASRGSTRPNHQFTNLLMRLNVYLRTVFGGMGGEAEVRHFTGSSLPVALEWIVACACMALVVLAARRSWSRSPAVDHDTGRTIRSFGTMYFLVALFGAPVLLAPARPWNLPAIDAERYLFAMLAPFALLVGGLAEDPSRRIRVAAIAAAFYVAAPTARISWGLVRGGGPDLGIYTLQGGGGYRGWRTPRQRVAVAWLIRDAVVADAHGRAATILVADYAFHPIHFANALTGVPTVDVTKFPPPDRPGGLFYFVRWSEGLFARGFQPARDIVANRALRERMERGFDDVHLLRRFVQPNGWPLFEIWVGTQRPRGSRRDG